MAEQANSKFIALIMAGGSGTRFWPMSQPEKPKQYLTLFGQRSLIQSTVDRLKHKTSTQNIFICSGESQKTLLKDQISEISGLILEPSGRNTAPCLMLSVATLLNRGYSPSTVMGVFPADHFIGNENAFLKILEYAIQEASTTRSLITLGITPSSPHTGYGYIEADGQGGTISFPVRKFVEKPNLEKAKQYLSSGNYYWNAGIFVWRLDVIAEAFKTYLPQEWDLIESAVKTGNVSDIYPKLKSQPIDIAVLEKSPKVRVIPADMQWSDIGSWNALLEHHQILNGQDNIIISKTPEQVKLLDSHQCLVANDSSKKVVLIGVKDLIVIESEHGLLITHRSQDQRVKEIL
jgi:mannose-1-phosphate guanylyltransferase